MDSLAPVGNQKLPCLDRCSHVDDAMPGLSGDSCSLNELPATFPSGPAVTFPTGVQPVDLSDDEDSNHVALQDRQFVRHIAHVFQPVPVVYKSLHAMVVLDAIVACFGMRKQ